MVALSEEESMQGKWLKKLINPHCSLIHIENTEQNNKSEAFRENKCIKEVLNYQPHYAWQKSLH